MAETDITPVALAMNVASADLADASGEVAATPADGWNILAGGANGDRLLLKFVDDGGGSATVTVKAGDRPPSHLPDLGDLAFSLAASDVKHISVEAGRFLRADGTIRIVPSDAGTKCMAFLLPKA